MHNYLDSSRLNRFINRYKKNQPHQGTLSASIQFYWWNNLCINRHPWHPAASKVILSIHENVLVDQGRTCALIDIQLHQGWSWASIDIKYIQLHQGSSGALIDIQDIQLHWGSSWASVDIQDIQLHWGSSWASDEIQDIQLLQGSSWALSILSMSIHRHPAASRVIRSNHRHSRHLAAMTSCHLSKWTRILSSGLTLVKNESLGIFFRPGTKRLPIWIFIFEKFARWIWFLLPFFFIITCKINEVTGVLLIHRVCQRFFLKLTIHHNRQQDENKYFSSRTPGHNLTFRIIGGFPKNLWEKMELFRIPCYFWNWGLRRGGNSYIIERMPSKKIFFHLHIPFFPHALHVYSHVYLGIPLTMTNSYLMPHALQDHHNFITKIIGIRITQKWKLLIGNDI